jgi:hypothetical protein
MKRTPPPLSMGYRLRISSIVDDRERKRKTRFILETSQSFASFVYDLSVEERRDRNHFHFKVLGLKPPQLSIPSAGRAKFERDYDDLAGTFDVTIESIDGSTNIFKLRISADRIKVVQAPKDTFTELIL